MTRVFLVDDHAMVRAGVRAELGTAVDVVGIATDHCVRATALDAARTSFGTFAHYLRTGVLAQAVDDDAVGRDRYLLHLPAYLGADADPDEAAEMRGHCEEFLRTLRDDERRHRPRR